MFLYELSEAALLELKHQHKLCKDKKEADRLKAVYLLGKKWPTSAIEEALLLDDSTIRNYFKLYKNKGIQGLLENSYTGKASYLTEAEMNLLEIHLQEQTYSRVSEIIEYVRNEFEVDYTDSGMRGVLKQLNFVYKKPEKIPYRVDEEAQKIFVERYKKIKTRKKYYIINTMKNLMRCGMQPKNFFTRLVIIRNDSAALLQACSASVMDWYTLPHLSRLRLAAKPLLSGIGTTFNSEV